MSTSRTAEWKRDGNERLLCRRLSFPCFRKRDWKQIGNETRFTLKRWKRAGNNLERTHSFPVSGYRQETRKTKPEKGAPNTCGNGDDYEHHRRRNQIFCQSPLTRASVGSQLSGGHEVVGNERPFFRGFSFPSFWKRSWKRTGNEPLITL